MGIKGGEHRVRPPEAGVRRLTVDSDQEVGECLVRTPAVKYAFHSVITEAARGPR